MKNGTYTSQMKRLHPVIVRKLERMEDMEFLAAEGLLDDQIARRMGVCTRTIERYRKLLREQPWLSSAG